MYTNGNLVGLTNENGFVTVYNHGAFVLVSVVAYDLNGKHVIRVSPQFFAGQFATLTIPYNAMNIGFEVNMNLGVQAWRGIYRTKFQTVPKKCFNATGILWYANCYEIPCPTGDNGGNGNQPCCCCCNCSC